jgi:hypothetical protein
MFIMSVTLLRHWHLWRPHPQIIKLIILHIYLERLAPQKDDRHIRSPNKPSRHRSRNLVQIYCDDIP